MYIIFVSKIWKYNINNNYKTYKQRPPYIMIIYDLLYLLREWTENKIYNCFNWFQGSSVPTYSWKNTYEVLSPPYSWYAPLRSGTYSITNLQCKCIKIFPLERCRLCMINCLSNHPWSIAIRYDYVIKAKR